MNLFRNLIQGAAGGLLGGSTLGLVEAVYLLATQGAPDLLSPFYAFVLYGLIGLPIGLGGGLLASLVERFKPQKEGGEALAFSLGSVAAVAPLLLFILMYLANKVVYAEAGVPTTGKLVILGIVGVYAVLELTVGRSLLRGPGAFLLKGPGVLGLWGAIAAVTLAVSFVPVGDDPRASWASGKGAAGELASAPNVLLITVDTLRADHLGTYGMQGDPSPTLDAIAADGIVFEHAFAAASWTRSSFASLWSSRIPSSHNADKKASRMPDEVDLLSEVLQGAGVTTANLANNINVTSTFNFDQGWDTFIYESPDYAFGATESVFSLTLYKVVHKLNEKLGGAKVVSRFYQPADVVLADAQAFIQANQDARWMLGVHLMEPHDPYFEHPYLRGEGSDEFNGIGYARAEHEHPDPADAKYLAEVYLQEIVHMDRKLAGFVQWLKSEGIYDDLVIVITADHGEEFDEHGGFWHGTTLYEEQIHVPLIFKLPGNALAGTRVGWQARVIDVAPTISGLMGVTPSEQWEGEDLLADVRATLAEAQAAQEALDAAKATVAELVNLVENGEADEDTLTAYREAESAVQAAAAREADTCRAYEEAQRRLVVAEQDFEGNQIMALRKGGFKFIRANEGNPRGLPTEALYDVITDAGEQENLVGGSGNRCGSFVADLPGVYDEELGAVVVAAKQRASSGGNAEMSEAEKAKLCALGYLSGPDCE